MAYWLFVLLPFAVNELREIKTSVWDIDKSWLGWGSFCVCPAAWLLLEMSHGISNFSDR